MTNDKTYNLNDNVSDDFEFQLGGKKYKMRYPLIEELDKMQDILDKSDDNKLMDYVYGFITPVGEAPNIKDTMQKQNVRLLRNFVTMIRVEFGIE